MPQEYSRSQRVADQIQKQLAELIQHNVKDPRVGMVTVTAVRVSKEFDSAQVFVTVLGDQQTIDETLEGLGQASGYLRSELARRIKLRMTPRLSFKYDRSLEEGNRLSALINAAAPARDSDD